jgi:hypothetical protein
MPPCWSAGRCPLWTSRARAGRSRRPGGGERPHRHTHSLTTRATQQRVRGARRGNRPQHARLRRRQGKVRRPGLGSFALAPAWSVQLAMNGRDAMTTTQAHLQVPRLLDLSHHVHAWRGVPGGTTAKDSVSLETRRTPAATVREGKGPAAVVRTPAAPATGRAARVPQCLPGCQDRHTAAPRLTPESTT